MIARFFQKSKPISFLSLLVLLFIYASAQSFYKTHTFNLIALTQFLGSFLFFVAFVFLSDFIIRKNELTPDNYYAIFILVVLFGLFPTVLSFSKLSLSHFFILLAARRIYSIRTKKQLLSKFFDSGLFIGVAYLLYPPSGIYLLLFYASYFIYIRIINKDLLIAILGFSTPIFITFAYFFFNDKILLFNNITEINLGFNFTKFTNASFFIPLILVLLLLLWALFKNFANRHSLDNEGKNNSTLIVYHLLITLLILSLNNMNIEESIAFLFLPIAIIIGNLLTFIKKSWLKEIVLYCMLILSLIVSFI